MHRAGANADADAVVDHKQGNLKATLVVTIINPIVHCPSSIATRLLRKSTLEPCSCWNSPISDHLPRIGLRTVQYMHCVHLASEGKLHLTQAPPFVFRHRRQHSPLHPRHGPQRSGRFSLVSNTTKTILPRSLRCLVSLHLPHLPSPWARLSCPAGLWGSEKLQLLLLASICWVARRRKTQKEESQMQVCDKTYISSITFASSSCLPLQHRYAGISPEAANRPHSL